MGDPADARPALVGRSFGMTYMLSTQTPATPEQFEAVDAVVGPDMPTGLLARYIGVTDVGVAVTTMWASKADADRFFVERLRPAVQQVTGVDEPPPPQATIGYEVTHELLPTNR
jgi:hypothetical protein